jgi:hypothetical protein
MGEVDELSDLMDDGLPTAEQGFKGGSVDKTSGMITRKRRSYNHVGQSRQIRYFPVN